MGKVKLAKPRPNYVLRDLPDKPEATFARALKEVRDARRQRDQALTGFPFVSESSPDTASSAGTGPSA